MNGTIYIENNLKGLLSIAIEDSEGDSACVHLSKEEVKALIYRLENAEVE